MDPITRRQMALPQTLRIEATTRPVHPLEELSMAQLQKLADEFDLGRIVQMDAPFNTQCNLTDPFRTGQGTFILRARHAEDYAERVEFLHNVIRYLRSRGFPAPEVLKTRRGKAWTLWGDRLVEVQRFVPHDVGTHRDWSRMNAAGSILGELHRHLHALPKSMGFVPPEMRNDLTPTECLEHSDTVLARVRAQRDADPDTRESAIQAIETVQQLAPPIANNHERIIGGMPWNVVHGDFHPWNLLYRGDDVAAVVDYDFLQERERIFDVAYAMRSLVANLDFPPGAAENISYDSLPWWKLHIWLDQYDESSYQPLTDRERAHLPGELMRLQLVEIVASGLQDNPAQAVAEAARGLPIYMWLHNQSLLFV